jgi:hypothetical protein
LDPNFSEQFNEYIVDASGFTPETFLIIPDNTDIDNQIISLLNENVSISGLINWDYAELKYIRVLNITKLQNNTEKL